MPDSQPVAIVDIGSNSVRLVVYSGPTRSPSVIFNEKVMAGLGRRVEGKAELSKESRDRALAALRRFKLLVEQMGVTRSRAVATAAVRDASNGAAFLAAVRDTGFDARILSGDEEGEMAGLGVISAIPGADGIVGDLGGGSLELVEIAGGKVRHSASLPLGVLRLDAILKKGDGALAKQLTKAVTAAGFHDRGAGRPFYLVGGSWRALAQLDMLFSGHPLPITHQHVIPPKRLGALQEAIASLDKARAKNIPSLSVSRVPTLPNANILLRMLADELRPSELIVSSWGIREGLLYADLDEETRARDPLIEAAREAGTGLGRFAQHGHLLDRWIAPVFADAPEMARLRLAACHLADIAWQTHPDFRAERGIDMALHGNWVGIDAAGRVMLAQALSTSFGGGLDFPDAGIAALCPPEERLRAALWGLAMRLGQRLSGGVAAGLERSRLSVEGGTLLLELGERDEGLYGETVERRLKTLATARGLVPQAAVLSRSGAR